MLKLLAILGIALIFEAIGVVFLKQGLKEISSLTQVSLPEIIQLIGRGVTNRHIILGVFFEALFFIGLLMLMSKADVSFVWPLTSLSFVVTTIAAKVYLDEPVSGLRWSGVCLIMMGAALISWTEMNRPSASSADSQLVAPSSGNSFSTQ